MANILVVEDDPIIRQTVEYALKRAGFTVAAVADGSIALDTAGAVAPGPRPARPDAAGHGRLPDRRAAPREGQGDRDHHGHRPRHRARQGARPRRRRRRLHHQAVLDGGAARARPRQPAARARQRDARRRTRDRGRRPAYRAQELPGLRCRASRSACASRSSSCSSRLPSARASSRLGRYSPRRSGATSTSPRRARSTCTSGGCARRSRTRRSSSTSTPCTAWATASNRWPRARTAEDSVRR